MRSFWWRHWAPYMRGLLVTHQVPIASLPGPAADTFRTWLDGGGWAAVLGPASARQEMADGPSGPGPAWHIVELDGPATPTTPPRLPNDPPLRGWY